ncbi:PREDICTED: serine-rich single-pass membrane protein 1 [Miniopterus natalensis]|uniref:serine-rich single-pass membrane protein 1 n=1 Tax=Miniopterus natalensis TaxID=291302 RepID=UPI0007A6B5B5|nr:PREDICTED: serine-rich single-pass membrane protein 1 [Miniopterus natalensis]
MGKLLSLFWEVDPAPMPLSFTIPDQDYECQQDDSCGAIGIFLFWYFVVILVLMFFSRAPIRMSEKKKKEDSRTNILVSKASKDTSCKWQNKDGAWDSLQTKKKPKQGQFTPTTDSEVALVNAYLERRRSRHHLQFSQVNQTQRDSDTTECDSEESDSGASSWKESESGQPSPADITRKTAERQKNVGCYQIRQRPCSHCKAMRTNEWLTRHFLQNTSITAPMKREIQEENSEPDNTKFSSF